MKNSIQKPYVFLSYARDDIQKVEDLYWKLFNEGIKPWMDNKDILPGENWKATITQAINRATFFLACISSNSISKRGVIQAEIKQALDIWEQKLEDDIYLIPIKLENCEVPDSLNKFQCVDLFETDGLEKLKKSIYTGNNYFVENQRIENKSFHSVPEFFDRYHEFINKLVTDKIFDKSSDVLLKQQLFFNNIRELLKAELVYYVDDNVASIKYESRAKQFFEQVKTEELHKQISVEYPQISYINKPYIITNIIKKSDASYYGCVVLPLQSDDKNSLLIICGAQECLSNINDIDCLIFKELNDVTDGFKTLKSSMTLKMAIFDKLKSVYNYVCEKMYEERFNYFKCQLERIEMHFEPIVFLSKYPNSIKIKGWEALARDKGTQNAPTYLFKTAETWGVRFKTELDLYCLRKAFETYRPQIRRADDSRPLHINVYPSTIERTIYRRELTKLIEEQLLGEDEQLVLEISEKTWIPTSNSEIEESHHLEYFRDVMLELSRSFGVKFAIDDFGVGYSSISRLNRLRPSYVKVDRDILHHKHDLGKETIKYLMNLSNKLAIKGITIIVEGVDLDSKISLNELVNELNIKYAQGYLLEKAKPNLELRLNEAKKRDIANNIKGQ